MVAVNGVAVTVFVLQSTGWSPPTDAQTDPAQRTATATVTARRPFHEAVSRQARRARHSRQVFGLTGAHRVVLLLVVASQSRFVLRPVLEDDVRSCLPLRDSPGLAPGSLL